MAVLGIIAEYDPFHNGHLHHLREAVSMSSPSSVLVALSGPFKQRGEAALLSPFDRASCAMAAGADAVFALPACWTVRDAEHYALGAVHCLASLGTDRLAFGAETADLSLLRQTADLLEDPPAAFRESLRDALSDGAGYPSAVSAAAGACLAESREVLDRPNNILAVCYLRAIRRLRLSIEPVVIPRSGDYHADQVCAGAPSASALRDALRRGAWQNALAALPPVSNQAVRSAFLSGRVPDPGRLDSLLLSKLRAMTPEEASHLPDCPEGLDRALAAAAAECGSREELIAKLTSRRYPAARISRLCAYVLLGLTKKSLGSETLPDRVLLLALKKNPSLTGSWKNTSLQVLTAPEYLKAADPAEQEAWRLWALAAGLPVSWPYTQKLFTGC